MKTMHKRLAIAIASAGLLTLYACGGGGGGGTASNNTTSSTMSGVAVVGAPLTGASVKVIDATGATVGTASTGSDGSYTLSFNPASYVAPFVIAVTGAVGAADTTLVSVQPTSDSATVNITPITHAIAAQMSSTGNPVDLIANIGTDKGNITAANISSSEQAFRTALGANMTAVGLTASDNLMSAAFNSKFDRLLDNVHVDVTPNGTVTMFSSAGAAVDDLAPTATTPAAAKVVVLAKGTLPSAGDLANLPAPTAPIGIDVVEAARVALNNCFAVSAASGRSITTPACTNIAIAGYLHDGRNSTAEFGGLLSDAGNDNMQFQKPEILRQLSTVAGSERLVVRLSAIRTDGQVRELVTVAANNNTPASGWQLVGNQRVFETFVNGAASKRISANTPANSRNETGLNMYVGNVGGANSLIIQSVVVTGPGLPVAGITLKPKTGCDFLAIVDSTTGTPTFCSSYYRLRSLKTDGSAFTPAATSQYLFDTTATDASIQTIKPLDLYQFVITKTPAAGSGTLTYWNRLRSRPLTVAEMGLVKFVDFTPSTIALMTTATLYTGGAKPTVGWTVPSYGARPYLAYFFHPSGSDFLRFPLGTNSATIPCTGNTDCVAPADGTYIMPMATPGQNVFQTTARNRFDTQIFTQLAQ